jgi:hypothetical protein
MKGSICRFRKKSAEGSPDDSPPFPRSKVLAGSGMKLLARAGRRLIIPESGLMTLRQICHNALTEARKIVRLSENSCLAKCRRRYLSVEARRMMVRKSRADQRPNKGVPLSPARYPMGRIWQLSH